MSLGVEFAKVGRDGAFSADAGIVMEASRMSLFEEFAANKFDATDTALLTQPDAAVGMTDLSNTAQDLLASATTLFGVDKGVQMAAAPDPSDVQPVQTTMQDLRDGMKGLEGIDRIATFRHIADPNTKGQFDKNVRPNDATNSAQLDDMTKMNDDINVQEENVLAALDAVEQGQVIPEGEKPGEQTAEATPNEGITPGGVARSLAAGTFAGAAAGALLGSGPIGATVAAVTTLTDVAQMASAMGQGTMGRSTGSSTTVTAKNKEEAARLEMDSTSGSRGPVSGTFDAAAVRAATPAAALPDDKLTMAEVNVAKSSITDIGGARMTQTAELNQMLAEIDMRRQQLSPQFERAQRLDQRFDEIKQDGQKLDLAGAQQAASVIGIDRIRFNGSGGPQGFTAMS